MARLVDSDMLQISATAYTSWNTVAFQRGTVLVTDLTLVGAALWHCRYAPILV